MATSVASVVSHFPEAENGFTTTTAGSVGSGAGTVTLNSVAGYTNGKPVVLVIDPTDPAKKQTFTGIVDTSGVQITSVVWTAGTNQTHALGATVVDYATATHISMISKGVEVEHNQDGTHDEAIIQSRSADTAPASGDLILTSDVSASNALKKVTLANLFATPPVTSGTMSATDWKEGVLPAQSGTIVNNGNRSYDIPFASTVASLLSPGMRLRTTRTVTAPTQCADLELSSSQFFSRSAPTGLAMVDDFTVMAWIKVESYGTFQGIISRQNGAVDGWSFQLQGDGRVALAGARAADDNVISYQSVPLGKWTHVAASIDSSGATGAIYIDGVLVPSVYTNGGNTSFQTPTADLRIGAKESGTLFLDGKIAQAAIFDAVISASTIRSYMSQGLAGTETNCVGAWSLNGVLTDLDANANTLTASGGAAATNADSPFGQDSNGVTAGTTDHALVMKVSTTTATVQVPEGCTIPTSGGVSAVAYSTATSPFGFTLDKFRWATDYFLNSANDKTSGITVATYYNINGNNFTLPIGAWSISGSFSGAVTHAGVTYLAQTIALSSSSSTLIDDRMAVSTNFINASLIENNIRFAQFQPTPIAVSSATPMYVLNWTNQSTTTLLRTSYAKITAIPAGV